jgi:hypothetical protein
MIFKIGKKLFNRVKRPTCTLKFVSAVVEKGSGEISAVSFSAVHTSLPYPAYFK